MNYAVIACQTLGDELTKAIHDTGCRYPVFWVDSEYHLDPNKLREKLQQEIDSLQDFDCVLLAYGSCGNGLVDLAATTADLIIPRTDDCISMVLSEPGKTFDRLKETYFLTKGWMEGSKGLLNEYRSAMERYGEARTKRIFGLMLKHYQKLLVIDTKAYNIDEWMHKAQEIAEITNLQLETTDGSIWFLKQLLTGPYDENFCVIKKGQKVNLSDFRSNRNT
jgi:hypothetical protein